MRALGLAALARSPGRWVVQQVQRWSQVLQVAGLLLLAGWLLAGWGLRGRRLVLWLTAPVLLGLALVFLLGPGRLCPKEPYEGPTLIRVAQDHALTALDLPGLACAAAGLLLGRWLLWARLTRR